MATDTIRIIGANSMLSWKGVEFEDHLPGQPSQLNPVAFKDMRSPRFIVTVDTEEEFDWSSPFQRSGYGTGHVREVGRFQSICDEYRVKPIYLVDYPILCDAAAVDIFNEILAADKCEIGAQLHAWVTPPFDEEVSVKNSYACNLPAQLEKQKIEALFQKIENVFGIKADIYRAGRYGAGPHTVEMLKQLGARIDTSVRSYFNYAHQDGPNYGRSSLHPYWLEPGQLMELPLTSVFGGMLRFSGPKLFSNIFGSDTSRALLARAGLLERIALTPEGIPLDRAIKAIDIAIDQQLPVLNFSFHSPSLEPGHTPYVRNQADLDKFYHWWRTVFEHLHNRGVTPSRACELIEAAF
jgi:hypothetical protein